MGFAENSAHELVQVTWAVFFEKIENFEGRSHIKTYLFGILFNKANEARRDKRKYHATEGIDEIMEKRFREDGHWTTPPLDPHRFMEASETLDLIKQCLDTLPVNQRAAFSLREIEDKKSEEICNILDVSVTNLGVLMYRARNRLRECIEAKASGTVRATNG
jgi:RNA polymerase sigma-70 factor (ECF subfamily)